MGVLKGEFLTTVPGFLAGNQETAWDTYCRHRVFLSEPGALLSLCSHTLPFRQVACYIWHSEIFYQYIVPCAPANIATQQSKSKSVIKLSECNLFPIFVCLTWIILLFHILGELELENLIIFTPKKMYSSLQKKTIQKVGI